MIDWNGKTDTYPLTLDSPVTVRFRDGTVSERGTVRDWHGCGGTDSNWNHAGEPEDIVGYDRRAI